jgi:hypothetical protein
MFDRVVKSRRRRKGRRRRRGHRYSDICLANDRSNGGSIGRRRMIPWAMTTSFLERMRREEERERISD